MSTCPVVYGKGKDTGANFVEQMRDASDVTRMMRQQGVKRNYQNDSRQFGKSIPPIGGIPHSSLLDMAHTTMAIGPSNTLTSQVGYMGTCTPCGSTATPPFSVTRVSLSLIRY
jgi:hypothetical protein